MTNLRPVTHELGDFFAAGTKLEFSRGEYIIRPEETPSGVFYIESGYIKACNTTKYGEENLLVVRKHAEVFPLIWVMTGDNRSVGYVAHTDAVVYKRSVQDLERLLESSTDALKEVLHVTTAMYQSQAERVNSLAYRTVRERVAYFLLTLSRRFGKEDKQGVLIELPLTRADIASSISATRETVSREFSKLTKKDVIAQQSGRIIITDKEYLESII